MSGFQPTTAQQAAINALVTDSSKERLRKIAAGEIDKGGMSTEGQIAHTGAGVGFGMAAGGLAALPVGLASMYGPTAVQKFRSKVLGDKLPRPFDVDSLLAKPEMLEQTMPGFSGLSREDKESVLASGYANGALDMIGSGKMIDGQLVTDRNPAVSFRLPNQHLLHQFETGKAPKMGQIMGRVYGRNIGSLQEQLDQANAIAPTKFMQKSGMGELQSFIDGVNSLMPTPTGSAQLAESATAERPGWQADYAPTQVQRPTFQGDRLPQTMNLVGRQPLTEQQKAAVNAIFGRA